MLAALARFRRTRLFEAVFVVGTAVGLALSVQAFAVKPYKIPSESMLPTLEVGDRVIVNRFAHRLGADPQVGQVLVFTPPQGAAELPARCGAPDRPGRVCPRPTRERAATTFVKRVVAVGGDTLAIAGGHVVRNGVRQLERYALPCGGGDGCDLPEPITIPDGTVFMMGDNRGNSDDSRFWGPIPTSWVIGEATLRYWPPARVGTP